MLARASSLVLLFIVIVAVFCCVTSAKAAGPRGNGSPGQARDDESESAR